MKKSMEAETTRFEIKAHSVELQSRYNFTYNFLVGAASMVKLAIEIEKKGEEASEDERLQHRAFVSGSIMQSVAALESEVWSLLNHGPGHHLGSNGLDKISKETLSVVAETFEKESLLNKYDLILQLIRKKKLDLGVQPMQDLKLAIGLRNEITHFKSLFTKKLNRKNLFKALEQKDAIPPPFYKRDNMNFFPHVCLTSSRAKWVLETVISFIRHYYDQLEIKSPIEGYDQNLIYV